MKKYFGFMTCLVLACVVFISGCTFSFGGESQNTNSGAANSKLPENATETQVTQACLDAVVSINVSKVLMGQISTYIGSGVGIKEGGYLATNYHVVDKMVEDNGWKLEIFHNDSTVPHEGQLVWENKNLDLALVRCSCKNLPFVTMKDRAVACSEQEILKPLEKVIAIGTPLDMEYKNTYTLGYINGLNRSSFSTIESENAWEQAKIYNIYEDLIQHQAPITNGNSGGPLFDMNGNLVGLNTLGRSDAIMYFSVPIYPMILVIDRAVAAFESDSSYEIVSIGITAVDALVASFSQDINFNESGVYVASVAGGSAAFGKLVIGDVISKITINGVGNNIEERNDLIYSLMKANNGDTMKVTVKRGASVIDFDIQVA